MRKLRMSAIVAGVLVGGLVLGGIGIATAMTRTGMPGSPEARYATDDTSTITPPSGDTTDPAPPSDVTRPPVTPPSPVTSPPGTPPWFDPTSSVPTTCTPRPMPPHARGHAYGPVISHPHSGLHRGMR